MRSIWSKDIFPKSKSLRHYGRKKFFYKLFMIRSPRNAAVFGFSFIFLILSLTPGFIVISLPYIMNSKHTIAALILAASAIILPFVYGVLVLGYAYSGMMRKSFKKNASLTELSKCCAIFYTTGALIIFPCLIKQEKCFFACLGLAGGILLNIAFFYHKLYSSMNLNLVWVMAWAGLIMFIISLLAFRDGHRFRRINLWPFLVLISYVAVLNVYDSKLDSDIIKGQSEVSAILGRPIDVESYWKAQEEGLSLTSEPLNTLIKKNPNKYWYESDPTLAAEDYALHLADFKKQNPEFIAAAEAFLKLNVQPVRHTKTDMLSNMQMPELNVFRTVARYLSCELIANSKNREEVLKRNAELERMRDWAIANTSLISKLIGVAIEAIRLNSLAYPLAAGSLTEADFENLSKNNVDWGRAMADAIGDEASMFEDCFEYVAIQGKELEPNSSYKYAVKFMPLEFGIWFKRDYLFALDFYKKIKLFLEPSALTGKERYVLAEPDNGTMKKNIFILSGMLLPALDSLHAKQAEIQDYKQLVSIAFAIERYRKKYNKLPENLKALTPEFLPQEPLDSMNHLPIRYEHGTLGIETRDRKIQEVYGYRLYNFDSYEKRPGIKKERSFFTVVLKSQ